MKVILRSPTFLAARTNDEPTQIDIVAKHLSMFLIQRIQGRNKIAVWGFSLLNFGVTKK